MTTEQKDKIIGLRNSGRSYAEIAQELRMGKRKFQSNKHTFTVKVKEARRIEK